MKKHFLLLIMAFMSLTSWAESIKDANISLGNVEYGATAAPAPFVVWSGETLGSSQYEVDSKFYKDVDCTIEAKDNSSASYAINTLPVGTYYLKIIGKPTGGFDGWTSKAFQVTPAALTVTYTALLDRTYGDDPVALDGTKFSVSGFKNSETVSVLTGSAPTSYSTADNNAGVAKPVTFVGGWTSLNYTIKYSVTLNIEAKDLTSETLTIGTYADQVYKGAAYEPTVSVKWGEATLTQGTDYDIVGTTSSSDDLKSAKTQNISVKFKNNYKGTQSAGTFDITPATITVSVDDINKPYTGADQKDQKANAHFNFSGLVGEDNAKAAEIKDAFVTTGATVAYTGTSAIVPNDYELTIAGVTTTNTNYTFEYLPGKLTIDPAELMIKAVPAKKKVGGAEPTYETATPSGIFAGDEVIGVTFKRDKEGTEDGEKIGSYDIIPNKDAAKVMRGKTDVSAYYTLKVDEEYAQLTIEKGGIIVIIKDKEKFYGQDDPKEFEYQVIGLDGSDKLDAPVITREKVGTDEGELVGTYALTAKETPANPDASKYEDVTVYSGVMTIKKAQLTLNMPTLSIAKGKTATDLAALKSEIKAVSGLYKKGEELSTLYDLTFGSGVSTSGTPLATDKDQTEDKGYVITLTDDAKKSYEIITATTPEVTTATTISGKLIVGAGAGFGNTLPLVDDANAASKIAKKAGETFDHVTIQFTARDRGYSATATETFPWKAEKWTTMVLPFDITVAELSHALGYAIVNVINPEKTVVSGAGSEFWGKVTMKGGNGKDDVLAANKPFMLKLAEDIDPTVAYDFGKKTIVAPSDLTVDAGKEVKFTGTYAAKTVTKADNAAIWFMNGNEDGWQYIGASSSASWTIAPFEAYIDMSSVPAGARSITFNFEDIDGTVTAIKSINAENLNKNMSREGWYNLNGVKLQGAPTQKGIYIQNGKKVVVK